MSKEKEYVVVRDTATEAMNHLDEFQTKMDVFVKDNPIYTYESSLDYKEDKWYVSVKVKKDESKIIRRT